MLNFVRKFVLLPRPLTEKDVSLSFPFHGDFFFPVHIFLRVCPFKHPNCPWPCLSPGYLPTELNVQNQHLGEEVFSKPSEPSPSGFTLLLKDSPWSSQLLCALEIMLMTFTCLLKVFCRLSYLTQGQTRVFVFHYVICKHWVKLTLNYSSLLPSSLQRLLNIYYILNIQFKVGKIQRVHILVGKIETKTQFK